MKHLRILLFTVSSFIAAAAGAQTVDEVVDKHIEAMGGKEKLASLTSVRIENSLATQGIEVVVVRTVKHNVGDRVDVNVMGTDGYSFATPTTGWMFFPFFNQTEPVALSPEVIKGGLDQLDLQGSLFNYKDKGNKVELLGKETIDGAEAYKIKITSKEGVERTIFLDTKTYYMIRETRQADVNGSLVEVSVGYSDFRKTEEGYVFPYKISNAFGQGGEMNVVKVEVNKPVDEKLFTLQK